MHTMQTNLKNRLSVHRWQWYDHMVGYGLMVIEVGYVTMG